MTAPVGHIDQLSGCARAQSVRERTSPEGALALAHSSNVAPPPDINIVVNVPVVESTQEENVPSEVSQQIGFHFCPLGFKVRGVELNVVLEY